MINSVICKPRRTASLVLPLALCLMTCEFALLYVDSRLPLSESLNATPPPVVVPRIIPTTHSPKATAISTPTAVAQTSETDLYEDGEQPSEPQETKQEMAELDGPAIVIDRHDQIFAADNAVRFVEQQVLTNAATKHTPRGPASVWETCDALAQALTNGRVQPDFDSTEPALYVGVKFIIPIGRSPIRSQN